MRVFVALTLAILAACSTTPSPDAPVRPEAPKPQAAAPAPAVPQPVPVQPASVAPPRAVLRVCADPADLPWSDEEGRGFENALAELVAKTFDLDLAYTPAPAARDRAAELLDAKACDVLMAVPVETVGHPTTRPYARTPYVFVQRTRAGTPVVRALDDRALRRMKIGVQTVGRDLASTPAGEALVNAGLAKNAVPFPMGAGGAAPGSIVQAVARGALDVALVLGPQAAFYAQSTKSGVTLTAARVAARGAPLERTLAMVVGRNNPRLRDALDTFVVERRAEIDRILTAYGVPRSDRTSTSSR